MLSGDSTVQSFTFNGESVTFIYEDYDTSENYEVIIETPIIYSELSGGEDCVHMRLEDSIGVLPIDEKSGLFVLPSEFHQQMSSINKGLHIFAGLKPTKYTKVFLLVGKGKILICPVENENSISITSA